ncbi:MAG: prolyl oligopeptidase family serine peptidase [Phycisphaera sp.]|nr:prolyl oligopeptidase family serine peptidase [Phycisphaera sp.]
MRYVAALFVVLFLSAAAMAGEPWPGAAKDWKGFERHDFKVADRAAYVVVPKTPAAGNPWYWRTRFPGVAINDDLDLLNRGWTVAYIDVSNLYGAPTAVQAMDAFYDEMTGKYGLSTKPVLKGLSRGGLFIFNYAAAHPDRVAAIYGDAPVCDFKSWPGGKGTGKGSTGDWKRLIGVYGFKDEAEAIAYTHNPIDNLEPIAKAHVPVLIVAGDSDHVVPFVENGGVVQQRIEKLGGHIKVILKPGCDHHPHGLTDAAPIVEFILEQADYPGKAAK